MTATTPPPLLLERERRHRHADASTAPARSTPSTCPWPLALRDAVRTLAQDRQRCAAWCWKARARAFMAGRRPGHAGVPTPCSGAARPAGTAQRSRGAAGRNSNAPVIAQVHGVAAGAGLSLMLQADFVLRRRGHALQPGLHQPRHQLRCGRIVGAAAPGGPAPRAGDCDARRHPGQRPGAPSAWAWSTAWCRAAELDAAVQRPGPAPGQPAPPWRYGHMRRLMRNGPSTTDLPDATGRRGRAPSMACAHTRRPAARVSRPFTPSSPAAIPGPLIPFLNHP